MEHARARHLQAVPTIQPRSDDHAEKLRVLGTLAVGVAHDMRNVLNGLYLRVQMCERSRVRSEIDQALAQMRQDIFVGIQLLERVQSFGRPESAQPTLVDLNSVVVEACALASARTDGGRRIVIEQDLGAPPLILGWRGEIVTAVLNLVINAIDVTPPNARVRVRTSARGNFACVHVEDEGLGIPADVLDHMFEPFFTTKGTRGTGLGLTSVAQCVERHGGELRVNNKPSGGATIGLYFP